MRLFTTFSLGIIMALCCQNTSAQLVIKYNGEPADLREMKNRTLIVELQDEDEKKIKYLSRSERRADELQEYRSYLKSYNDNIQKFISKFWTFNEKIEFKRTSELEEYVGDDKYVLMTYSQTKVNKIGNDQKYSYFPPALLYHRAEKALNRADFKFFLPFGIGRKDAESISGGFKFIIPQIQNHMNQMIKTNKTEKFSDYLKSFAVKNCSRLKDYTVFMEDEMVPKLVKEDNMAKHYKGGTLKVVSPADINEFYMNEEPGKAILIAIPYGIVKFDGGGYKSTFFKVGIACDTSEILWMYHPGKRLFGASIDSNLMKPELNSLSDCDI